jgi:hypothetical protein
LAGQWSELWSAAGSDGVARKIFDRELADAHAESRQSRSEADRWRSNSIRLSKEIAAWKAGHQEGRADVVGIVPMLIAARQNSAACSCTADDNTPSST